ncbi:MAG: hypothetical protein JO303_12045, partial [Caulobacteraceae bacterium]|nr:hypothetical protein [Caulobacteraceae bacterium]
MTVGWYAPVVVLVGLWLWLKGDVLGSVVALMFFSLFGGGAAFIIGTASIQPDYFFLVFLTIHVAFKMLAREKAIDLGLKVNGYLTFFSLFGAITAFILPKLFFRSMSIPPVQINNAQTYYLAPLGPSKQNVTTAIYMIGTMLASIAAGIASANPKSRRAIVTWAMIIAWIHIGFGVWGVAATKIGGAQMLSFFRNAKYAELIEQNQGYVRINGIFPEPSEYGAYAFFWLVFMAELWLRRVRPLWTGLTAAALFLLVVACTSSSTYFALAVYSAVMVVRWLLVPQGLPAGKLIIIGLGGLSAVFVALILIAFVPEIAAVAGRVIGAFTTHKLQSSSGTQRMFWAKAGVTAFVKSYGIGVGAGSFRCSSLLLAILGSTGVIGTSAFLGHVLAIFRPLDARTYRWASSEDPVGVSAAWAACAGLLPAMVSAPTPDPDIQFAIF